jgi:hypothetical protein
MAAAKFAMSLDGDLLAEVDRAARAAGMTRSGWIAGILRASMRDHADARAAARRALAATGIELAPRVPGAPGYRELAYAILAITAE